ncbi:hypothetical protein ON010_g16721 [Phytophthora cinnamomi]|nr:hypothetical protein ON010_g16721 [Phytophthora cinnamomi]
MKENTGAALMEFCGLVETSTLKTGNCQYHALAMALLDNVFFYRGQCICNRKFNGQIKKGLKMAMEHELAEEYKHEERLIRLLSCMDDTSNLTEAESRQLLFEYMEDLGSSISKRTSFLGGGLWMTDFTLRLALKSMQRPIFVVVARNDLDSASYLVFEPQKVTTKKFTIESAGEFTLEDDKSKLWMKRFQRECKVFDNNEHLPIVLMYGQEHFSRLRFENPSTFSSSSQVKTETKGSEMKESTTASRKQKDNATDRGNQPRNAKQENTTTTSKPTVESKLREAIQQSGLTTQDKQQLMDIRYYGAERQEELSTVGALGLAPVVQKLLFDLDWDDPVQV